MKQSVIKLKDRIRAFAEDAKAGILHTDEECESYFNDIITAAAEVYRDPEIEMWIPVDENGRPMVYQDNGGIFLPLYTDGSEIRDPRQTVTISFHDVCDMIYENMANYEVLDMWNGDLIHMHEFMEAMEYAEKNVRFQGIMLNPDSGDLFALEDWILKAVVFKGIGVNSVNFYDAETGEKKILI